MDLSRILKTSIFLISFVFFTSILTALPVFSQDTTDLEKEVDKKSQEVKDKESNLDKVKREIENILKSSLGVDEKIKLMDKEVENIDVYIKSVEKVIVAREKVVKEKETEIAKEQKSLDDIALSLYKSSRFGFWEYLFANRSADDVIRGYFMKKLSGLGYIDKMKLLSQNYAQLKQEKLELELEKKGLEDEKKNLEKSRSDLIAQKQALLAQAGAKKSLSAKLGSDISSLKGEISKLQEAILLAKASGGIIGAGDVPGSSDNVYSKAGFLANASSGNFAVFSFGAYTHRNGMSQWGAVARANQGQSYTTILSAYYPGKAIRTGSVVINGQSQSIMKNVKTTTMGTLDFENDYLMRLAEMPESWDMDALKAQVIAARTYAVNYTQNGVGTICTTQSCQVIGNKKTGAWKTAVEATKGMILTNSSGAPFSAQYAAVHGGWVNSVGWDTTDKAGGSGNWTAKAWESLSGVSWFYKTWPTLLNGPVCNSGKKDSTGNNKYYLSNREMADIINVWLVNQGSGLKGSVDHSRIVPVTISDCKIAGLSGNPYSKDELANLLNNPVTQVNSVVSTFNTQAQTTTVLFGTNVGTISIPGSSFRAMYNLRAPGYLQIPPQGSNVTFINIEKK